MPRRGRHRASLPKRLLAIVAALLITGGVVTVAGSAFADDDGGIFSALSGEDSSSSSGGEPDDEGDESSDGATDGSEEGSGEEGADQDGQDGEGSGRERQDRDRPDQDDGEVEGDNEGAAVEAAEAADPFPGRDQAADASEDDYVDIADVEPNGGDFGEGGRFTGGSYSVDCGVSDHNNSDNYMAAPGKRNGAQHVHDYVGNESTDANSDDDSLEQAGTSCVNGDRSTFFWPVLRDLNGPSPDEGEDGGSIDGNRGAIMRPLSAQLSFHGHGDLEEMRAMPTHLMMIMGNAKQGAQNGENANAKYTCTGQEDRVTDKYPICGEGSNLVRILDYPSCWDGQNLESANVRDHMAFAEDDGSCSDGFVPIPALRITLTFDQPEGRAFQIDSFPNEQHAPETDHSDYENLASQDSNDAGLLCIQRNEDCTNLPQ